MPWVGINTSGVAYTVSPALPYTIAGTLNFVGDVLTATDYTNFGWNLEFATAQQVRVTVQSFSAASLPPSPGTISALDAPFGVNPTQVSTTSMTPVEAQSAGATIISYSSPQNGEILISNSSQVLIEVFVAPVLTCEEHGRVTRAYVSGYQRTRIHGSRLVRGERRCLVADFNGAIPPARSIASVTWRTNQHHAISMANAQIVDGGREVIVDITAQAGAGATIKCEVTLDNGEVYNQLFHVTVLPAPWFTGETTPASGPQALTATA